MFRRVRQYLHWLWHDAIRDAIDLAIIEAWGDVPFVDEDDEL